MNFEALHRAVIEKLNAELFVNHVDATRPDRLPSLTVINADKKATRYRGVAAVLRLAAELDVDLEAETGPAGCGAQEVSNHEK